MEKTEGIEKEGLDEAKRWRPLSDKLGPGYENMEYDSFLNPPPIRHVGGDKVGTLYELKIWDKLRAIAEESERERIRHEQDDRPATTADRTYRALAYLKSSERHHAPYCTARHIKKCTCGATQQNVLVKELRKILGETVG